MAFRLEDKLLNLVKVFSLVDEDHLLKSEDIKLLKEYYLKSGKPQISLLCYFLSLDYPSFPEVSKEWIRRILLREGVYSPGNRGKVFRSGFSAPFPGLLV